MKVIKSLEEVKGWWLGIVFNEKGPDKENIFQAVWFPKIDGERSMQAFANNHLNTTHNWGEITITGFIRYIPQVVRQKIGDSYGWSRYTENSDGTYDNRRVESVEMTVFGHKTPLEKKYPKTYIKTPKGWVPALLVSYYQELERIEKALKAEWKFNDEFREGMKSGNILETFRKNTVLFNPPKKEVKEEKQYRVVEIPAMPGYDESCGMNYKSATGQFQYSLLEKNIPSPTRWKDRSSQEYWAKKENYVKISA